MNDFLPSEYKIPDSSNYLRFKDGENTFRVLSSAITGYKYWTEDTKPIRSPKPFLKTPNIRIDKEGHAVKVKHFWAFVVWNYKAEKVQILEITQSTIQGAIKSLVDNKNWGDPKEFDITVSRTGDGFDTEYSTMPNPKATLPPEATQAYISVKIDLEQLFSGGDPFGADTAKKPEFLKDDENGKKEDQAELESEEPTGHFPVIN